MVIYFNIIMILIMILNYVYGRGPSSERERDIQYSSFTRFANPGETFTTNLLFALNMQALHGYRILF